MAHMIPSGFRQASEGGAEHRTRAPSGAAGAGDKDGALARLELTGVESRTRVTTAFGEVPAHLLRVNDMVRGADGRFHRIRHIDVVRFEAAALRAMPGAGPVRIHAGALRPGVPARDIYLAPEQTIVVPTGGGMKEVTAQELLSRPKVAREPIEQVAYFRLDLGGAEVILAEKATLRLSPPAASPER